MSWKMGGGEQAGGRDRGGDGFEKSRSAVFGYLDGLEGVGGRNRAGVDPRVRFRLKEENHVLVGRKHAG